LAGRSTQSQLPETNLVDGRQKTAVSDWLLAGVRLPIIGSW